MAATTFGIEGKGIMRVGQEVAEDEKKLIDPGSVYKRRPPRDVKVRKVGKFKPVEKNMRAAVPPERNQLGSLLISGLHVGAMHENENMFHEVGINVPNIKLPFLRAKSKSRRSSRPLPGASTVQTNFELTGLKLGFVHDNADANAPDAEE